MSQLARRSFSRSVRWAVLPALAVLGLALFPQSATAAQAPDTIEQHIELLSETISNQLVATTISTPRGELFGTSKFAPTPTASFEVVAKVTGAQGSAGWNVVLKDVNGFQISTASISFGAADSAFTHKYVSHTWPMAWSEIGSISLTPQGTIPGAIDVRKAYVKLNQNGIITKTLGRLPMGTKQLAITNTSYTALTDPNIFKYNAADFDPAPVIKLRASGRGSPCYFNVSLYNDAGTMVPGSELTFYNGVGSQESGALALTNGVKYQVRVKIFTGCIGEGPSGDSPDSGDPEVPSGDFYSADLIFEQSTADTAGITKTVGFYPGVTAAVDSPTNNEDLNFSFRAPTINIPNAITGDWSYVAKRTSGSGFVGVSLKQGGSVIGAAAATSAGTTFDLSAPVTLGSFGSQTLTKSYSSLGSATTARISASLMRLVLALRDISAPEITPGSVSWTNTAFSPVLPSANPKSKTKLSFSLTDFSSATFDVAMSGPTSFTLTGLPTTGTGLNKTAEWTWDGRNNGSVVPDGTYTASITLTDGAGNVSPPNAVSQTVVVDTVMPAISNYQVATSPATSPVRFSPGTDGYLDTATFSASLNEQTTWAITLASGGGSPVRTLGGSGNQISIPWNGKNQIDTSYVGDATYAGTLTATDLAGNASTGVVQVIIDRTGPTTSTPSPLPFSPNSDGSKDTSTVNSTVSDPWGPVTWTLQIKQGSTLIKEVTGSNSVSYEWDGYNDANALVADGTYTVILTTTDGGANLSVRTASVVVDTLSPAIDVLSVWPPAGYNTQYLSQPLSAPVTDERSGLDLAQLKFTLEDVTNEAAVTSVDYNASMVYGGRMAVSWVPLTNNHRYRLKALASDVAGNATVVRQGRPFQTITFSATPPNAEIPASACTVSSNINVATQTRDVTCTDVPLSILATTATTSGTVHSGTGFIDARAPLNSAVLFTSIAGIEQTQPAYAAGTSSDQSMPFDVPGASLQSSTIPINGQTVVYGTLHSTVPAVWTSASIRMAPVATTVLASTCAGTGGANPCSPDPLHQGHYVELNTGQNASQVLASHEASYGLAGGKAYSSPKPSYFAAIPSRHLAAIASDWRVKSVAIDRIASADLTASAPAALAGGPYWIYVYDESQPNLTRNIAAGTFPSSGKVSLALPLAELFDRDSLHYYIRGMNAITPGVSTSGTLAGSTMGMPDDDLISDPFIEFGSLATESVSVHNTPEAAMADQCSACTNTGAQWNWPDPAGVAPPDPPGSTDVGIEPTTLSGSKALAPPSCASTNTCGAVVASGPTATYPQCALTGTFTRTCVIAHKPRPNISAFRGYSEKIQTTTNVFTFEHDARQSWTNGWRVESGPFKESGSTTLSETVGGTDTFPKREDCYGALVGGVDYDSSDDCPTYNGGGVENSGSLGAWGLDSWVWQRSIAVVCYIPTGCSYVDWEDLLPEFRNGGAEWGPPNLNTAGYNKKPSEVMDPSAPHGNRADYAPGATRRFYLAAGHEHENAASISVNFTEAMSGTTFNASFEYKRTGSSTVRGVNEYYYRKVPWTNEPQNPVQYGTDKGKAIFYDLGWDWKLEYITCKFADGWFPTEDADYCWKNNS